MLPPANPQPASVLTITIPGIARGKARIRTGAGRFFMAAKTRNAEAWIKHCAMGAVAEPLDGALAVRLDVACQVPASWSRTKRAAALGGAIRPVGRPDVDNVAKNFLDPLNGLVWRDDAQVVELTVVKRYADAPGCVMTVRAL